MKRIDSIRKSPIYINFDETLVGVTSVRAFRREEEFIEKNDQLINDNVRAWYPIVIAQRYVTKLRHFYRFSPYVMYMSK